MTASQRLDVTFAALADPTRRAILARLATGETSVKELAEPFAMSQPAISKHLKVLERAGLISRGRPARSSLDREPQREIAMTSPNTNHDLVLTRVMDVPREKLFRAWTEADLLKQWFAPLPYTTPHAEIDARPGGASYIVMRSPDGQDLPNRGVFLEVVKNEKVVFTDAFTKAWEPSAKPFFTGIVTFEDLGGGKTKYTAVARHWTAEDRETHEKMGFHEGWGQCADQLAALAAKL